LVVFVGASLVGLGTSGFAKVNLALAFIWVLLAIAVGREYIRRSRAQPATATSR